MMKNAKLIIPAIILILLAACAPEQPQQLSGVLRGTNGGAETEYSLEILKREELVSDTVKNWLETSAASSAPDSQGYYTLYNNGSEVMDMYLFMPAAKEIMGNIDVNNITATASGTTLMLSVDTGEKIKHTKESADLILHIYANAGSETAKAKSERLSVNGKSYSCTSSTFAVVR